MKFFWGVIQNKPNLKDFCEGGAYCAFNYSLLFTVIVVISCLFYTFTFNKLFGVCTF
jgi:hypothetical protein